MLKELPNTVVHCKTKEEYDRLMHIYEDAGWRWNGGKRPSEITFDSFNYYLCKDNFTRSSSAIFFEIPRQARVLSRVLSLSDFLREQGIDQPTIEIGKKYRPKDKPEEFKVGDWVEVIEEFAEWPTTFHVGERLELTDWNHAKYPVVVNVQGRAMDEDKCKSDPNRTFASGQKDSHGRASHVISKENHGKIRKCPPPNEKKIPFWKRGSTSVGKFSGGLLTQTADTGPTFWTTEEAFSESILEAMYQTLAQMTGINPRDLTPTPTPMSLVDSFNNSVLTREERVLRKAGVKNSCGTLTPEGEKLVLAFVADKFKAELVKEAKKFLKAKKGEYDED